MKWPVSVSLRCIFVYVHNLVFFVCLFCKIVLNVADNHYCIYFRILELLCICLKRMYNIYVLTVLHITRILNKK